MSKDIHNLIDTFGIEPKSPMKKQIKICYSKSGVSLEAAFYWYDGILKNESITIGSELIQLHQDATEEELLAIIKAHAYDNDAEITHRNYRNITYPYQFKKEKLNRDIEIIDSQITKAIHNVLDNYIVKIMNRNEWFFEYSHMMMLVIAEFDSDGKLANINYKHKDALLIENILGYFFSGLRIDPGEHGKLMILNRYFDKDKLNDKLKIKK